MKRNIAKSHVVSKNKTNEATTPLVRRNVKVNQSYTEPPKLKGNGLGQYKYPVCGTVPEDYYITRIIDACQKTTIKGEMIDVFYLLEPARQCYNRVNKLVPKGTKSDRYHIKQTYPVGSSFYEDFVSAMECALGVDPGTEIVLTDIIGNIKKHYKAYAKCIITFSDNDICITFENDFTNQNNAQEYANHINSKDKDEIIKRKTHGVANIKQFASDLKINIQAIANDSKIVMKLHIIIYKDDESINN